MRIAIVGGTGKEGGGMAARWAKAGHAVLIGSRNAERAEASAKALADAGHGDITGADNATVVKQADVVVLSVPYSAHASTLEGLKEVLQGKVMIDITVPLKPPKVRQVSLPAGSAAALEGQALLGEGVRVVAALHHVSSVHLADLDHAIECDVLACSDDKEALELALTMIGDLGVKALDAGPLANAVALESLTPVLLHLNKRYGSAGSGIRFTGL
ncbi:MAG: NADPH-dependent F420 reductase [Myxococcales bacterium]|nr:NADPH-dependent F420 reductase [Myxococcales bacterium]